MLQENIIEKTIEYKCTKCIKQFRRQAALARHMDFDHKEKSGSDEEDFSDGLEEDTDTSPSKLYIFLYIYRHVPQGCNVHKLVKYQS